MNNLIKYAWVALLIVGACVEVEAVLTQSQAAGPQGTLAWMVLDPGRARIPRAKIVLEGKGLSRAITSADDGTYSIDLPEGKYRIRVERDGFYAFRKSGLRIVSGGSVRLDIVIKGIRNDPAHP